MTTITHERVVHISIFSLLSANLNTNRALSTEKLERQAAKPVGCSGQSGGTTVHGHRLESESFIFRDTLTCELNGAHASDSVAGAFAG